MNLCILGFFPYKYFSVAYIYLTANVFWLFLTYYQILLGTKERK